jgi:hypothetical protein
LLTDPWWTARSILIRYLSRAKSTDRKNSPELVETMPRGTDSGGLKGVTVVRGGKEYAVTLPRFGQSTNASSINLNRDDLHEHFRKLTPKQRIAVLTIRDQNIATKLYTISNV